MRPLLCAFVALLVAAPVASAVVPFQTIAVPGPLTSINLGNDLSCQVAAQGDPQPSFEPAGAALGDCGTYMLVSNQATGEVQLFGPSDRVFLPATDQPYTPDASFAPDGQARSDSPGSGTVETQVLLGSTGLRAFEIDSYDGSPDGYMSALQIQNGDPNVAYDVTISHLFLCFLQGGTSGDFGTHDAVQGSLERPGCTTGPGVVPVRTEMLTSLVPNANWVVVEYGSTDTLLRAGPFPNTCRCGEDADLMVGLSWTRHIDVGATVSDMSWRTNSSGAQGTPAPQAEKTGTASTESGTVLVQAPGGQFVPLTGTQSIPVGSVVDTTKGVVSLSAAASGTVKTRTGSFGGGVFKFTQKRQKVGRKRLLTTRLALRGGNFAACGTRSVDGTAARKRTVRYLKAKASGQFAVIGKNSSGLERGTTWTTTDRCDGTLTAVKTGKVAVTDFARNKTVTVRAGHSYLARPRRG